jgi:hypothetical protein
VLRIGKRAPIPWRRIETTEGIFGWGEATSPPTTPAIVTQIRESGKLLTGQVAWDIQGHWTQIHRPAKSPGSTAGAGIRCYGQPHPGLRRTGERRQMSLYIRRLTKFSLQTATAIID